LQGSEKKVFFFKKPNPLSFFGFYWVFQIFYLNDQFGSLLVDLAHQHSFYLDSPVIIELSLVQVFAVFFNGFYPKNTRWILGY